ncbi:MAG: hypothetical protein IPJ71_05270 [Bdellovibrionales bacterium]|nr:hypothetical protein [Bdellovibrionales bacterium]
MNCLSSNIYSVLLRVLPGVVTGFFVIFSFGLASANVVDTSSKRVGESAWSGVIRYSVLTDLAQEVNPRSYTHGFLGSLEYSFNSSWSLGGDVSFRAGTVGDQIYKAPQQSKGERIDPEAGIVLNYEFLFFGNNSLKFFGGFDVFLDESSRLEGYLGLFSVGTEMNLVFSDVGLVMGHSFVISEMANTFEYSTEGSANPNLYYNYSFSNSLSFMKSLALNYTFGFKMTQYLDDYLSYSYSNKYGISAKWGQLSTGLSYENGGFTDDGYVDLWYIDAYRRLLKLTLSYLF